MILRCDVCQSADWLACAPGSEAEARYQDRVCILRPAPEVPARVWCAAHWAALFAQRAAPGSERPGFSRRSR